MDYSLLFSGMYPGFFQQPGIAGLPESHVFAELVMDLKRDTPLNTPYTCPEGITFGEYRGEPGALRDAVGKVEADWLPYFHPGARVYAALDGNTVAAFCILSDWGRRQGLLTGGPGCVGTVPDYRNKGIGLELVRRATGVLKEEGFDLSWIHYTHLEHWYRKIRYRTVIKWNCKGILFP